jgi:ribosomal-protein-alanine N-acetyltransferase
MIESEDLKIIALSHPQLIKYLEANNLLEKDLGLKQTNRNVSPAVKEMVEKFTLPKIKETGAQDFLFYTFWIVVDKKINTIVAELGFKGPPNEAGEVEIGYGTMPAFQGKGYMTKAVKTVVEWAHSREDIKSVLGSVDKKNPASIRVLEKSGFQFYEAKENLLWWKINV